MTTIEVNFDDLIGLCRSDVVVITLGGSTPLTPFATTGLHTRLTQLHNAIKVER